MGAALTVAVGLGVYPSVEDIDELIEIKRIVKPDLSIQRRYDDLFQQYRQVYDALAPIFRNLHEIR